MPASGSAVARLDAHRDYRTAVPAPDHFIPLLYLAGLVGGAPGDLDVLVGGYTYGSLSMTACTLGLACPRTHNAGGSPQPPAGLPADESDI